MLHRHIISLIALAIVASSFLGAHEAAAGAVPLTGADIINFVTNGDQSRPRISSSFNGTHAIVWEGRDGNGKGVIGNVFGIPNDFLANITISDDQYAPVVSYFENGNYIVAWRMATNGNSHKIVYRLFKSDTSPLGGEVIVDPIVSLGGGSVDIAHGGANDAYMLVWNDVGAGQLYRVYGPAGAPLTPVTFLNQTVGTTYGPPQVSRGPDGRTVALYQVDGRSYYVVFNADGSIARTETEIVGSDSNVDVSHAPNGDFVIVSSSHHNVFAQRYNSAGNPLGSVIEVCPCDGGSGYEAKEGLRVDHSSDGSFVVVWAERRFPPVPPHSYDIKGQCVAAGGTLVGPRMQIRGPSDDRRLASPDIAFYFDGNADRFAVVWEEDHSSTNDLEVMRTLYQLNPTTGIAEAISAPTVVGLRADSRPSVFSSATSIHFDLPSASPVTLRIFDTGGRVVRTLVDGAPFTPGAHGVDWDGRDATGDRVSTGVYFFRVSSNGLAASGKLTHTR